MGPRHLHQSHCAYHHSRPRVDSSGRSDFRTSNGSTDEDRERPSFVGEVAQLRASAAALPGRSSGPKPHIKAGSARGTIDDGYAAAVRTNDFHDDRQAEPGSVASRALAAPKTVEDARPVV